MNLGQTEDKIPASRRSKQSYYTDPVQASKITEGHFDSSEFLVLILIKGGLCFYARDRSQRVRLRYATAATSEVRHSGGDLRRH